MSLRYETVYRVKINDNLGDPGFWNTRFQDLDLRMNSSEVQFSKIDAAVQEIISLGIARIDNTYQPLLNALQAQATAAQAQVDAVVLDVTTLESTTTTQLGALVTEAQSFVTTLEALGDIDGGTF